MVKLSNMTKVPKNLQGVLWSVPVENLDLEKDKTYIIHQVLMYGTLEQICWLLDVYPKSEVKKTFLNKPQKVYTKPAFNYIKNFILGLDSIRLQDDKYVSTIY